MLEAGIQKMALDIILRSVLRKVPETNITYRLHNQVVIYLLSFRQHRARPPEHKVMHHGLARR